MIPFSIRPESYAWIGHLPIGTVKNVENDKYDYTGAYNSQICQYLHESSFCSQTLKLLLEELRKIKVDPDAVRIPGQLYNDLVDDAEDINEENL